MVSVLVAAVRDSERERRTYSHVNLSQNPLFMRLFEQVSRNGDLPSPGGGECSTLANSSGKRSKKLGGKERLPQSISRAISAIIVNALL
jgi:hypothetical protein